MHHEDTTVKIWEYYYKIRIPFLQSKSIDQLKREGVTLTGYHDYDSTIKDQWLTTMATVATMVEHFKNGTPIKVVNPKDVKEIYDSISDHIHSWRIMLERGLNTRNAPIEDLIVLDEFANSVYEHAKFQFTKDTVNSILAQQLAGTSTFGGGNHFLNLLNSSKPTADGKTFKVMEDGAIVINGENDEIEDRESLGTFFKHKVMTFSRF